MTAVVNIIQVRMMQLMVLEKLMIVQQIVSVFLSYIFRQSSNK